MAQDGGEEVEKEPLDKELQHTLEEARTVIPGLQALFSNSSTIRSKRPS